MYWRTPAAIAHKDQPVIHGFAAAGETPRTDRCWREVRIRVRTHPARQIVPVNMTAAQGSLNKPGGPARAWNSLAARHLRLILDRKYNY